MDFDTYQNRTQATAIYPGQGGMAGLTYSILGFVGESGELANRFKKVLRDNGGILTEDAREDLLSEAGDCLWYLARICEELHNSLDTVAAVNLHKLAMRAQRGVISGAGNNR